MLNIFFKPSHIFTVMRPAHGRHFQSKAPAARFPAVCLVCVSPISCPGGMKIFRLFSISPGCQRQEKNILIQKVNRLGFAWRAADGFGRICGRTAKVTGRAKNCFAGEACIPPPAGRMRCAMTWAPRRRKGYACWPPAPRSAPAARIRNPAAMWRPPRWLRTGMDGCGDSGRKTNCAWAKRCWACWDLLHAGRRNGPSYARAAVVRGRACGAGAERGAGTALRGPQRSGSADLLCAGHAAQAVGQIHLPARACAFPARTSACSRC